ncbi:MAG: efflux RND transporter periplasmic adaptor subunit [Bacteroidia bacterium]|nr:efflux RND transporter periplasmic adaptor subunit [Bacteroidia bacterium]
MKMKAKTILSNTYFRSSLLLIFGLFLGWLFFYHSDKNSTKEEVKKEEKSIVWTCSMHPQIRMDHKGLCPICAMDLIPLEQNVSEINDSAIVMTEEALKLAEVQTVVVSKQQPIKEVHLYGKIQADETSVQSIPAHVSGRIERLFVKYTGEKINKGQVIASIYSPELINAQKELLEAIKMKDVQPLLLEAAREKLSQFKLSGKQIEDIEKNGKLKSLVDVIANASGVVITKKVNSGDYVQIGTPLYEVADLSSVWAQFDAYESDLSWLKVGSQITYTLLALPGKEFKGNITFIDPVIDPQTRIAKVRVELNNSKGDFKPEMLATGIVKAKLPNSGNSIVVPQSAVLWTGKRSLVYVKIPNTTEPTFIMRNVTLGNYLQNSYEIIDGLNEGEEIVTNGTFSIDAAAQLAGKSSMMNAESGNSSAMQGMDMSESSNSVNNNKEEMNGMKMDANSETSTFKVNGLCEMCKDRIESTAKKISGVNSADWKTETKMLKLTFDKSKTSLVNIQKAIAAVGHDNGKYKAPDEVYNGLPECCKYRTK